MGPGAIVLFQFSGRPPIGWEIGMSSEDDRLFFTRRNAEGIAEKAELALDTDALDRLHRGLNALLRVASALGFPRLSVVLRNIEELCSAATDGGAERVADLLDKLDEATKRLLGECGAVPSAAQLHASPTRRQALDEMRRLLRVAIRERLATVIGGKPPPGARQPRRGRARDARVNWAITCLRLLYLDVTGEMPGWTTNQQQPAPFGRFVEAVVRAFNAPQLRHLGLHSISVADRLRDNAGKPRDRPPRVTADELIIVREARRLLLVDGCPVASLSSLHWRDYDAATGRLRIPFEDRRITVSTETRGLLAQLPKSEHTIFRAGPKTD